MVVDKVLNTIVPGRAAREAKKAEGDVSDERPARRDAAGFGRHRRRSEAAASLALATGGQAPPGLRLAE